VYENKGKKTIFPIKMATLSTQIERHFIPEHTYFSETVGFLAIFRALGNEFLASRCTNLRPLLQSEGNAWVRRDGRLYIRRMPVYATMYMKTQVLIGNSRDLQEIVCR
jgi:hypothetical protein